MRLIDAHKLWDVMNKATLHHIVTNTLWNTMKSVIDNAPTIDAVEVVRCKDCRWGDVLDSFDSGFCGNSNGLQGYITKDDYCSWGERRKP